MRRLGLALIAAVIATSAVHAATAPMATSPAPNRFSSNWLQLADARSYLHCHNGRPHIRCHKREWLPGLRLSGTSASAAATS